jgi:glycosyltransferase involved in cell wall biosynthesis
MRAGCIPVTVTKTGIGEIVDRYGVTLSGEVTTDEWQQNAINACINLLQNEEQRQKFEEQIIFRGKQLSWNNRKQDWMNLFSN